MMNSVRKEFQQYNLTAVQLKALERLMIRLDKSVISNQCY